MNKIQICFCQQGLFHSPIAHTSLKTPIFAIKRAQFYRTANQHLYFCLVLFVLFMPNQGTVDPPVHSVHSIQLWSRSSEETEISTMSIFRAAEMQISKVSLFCSSHSLFKWGWWLPDTVLQLVPRAGIPSLVLHPWHGLVCKYKCCCEAGDGSWRLLAPSFHEIKCFTLS